MGTRREPKRATITDIARQAQVSTATVSYALNDLPGVSKETRRRILEIADRMGWRPNSSARALHRSRVDAVGIVLVGSNQIKGALPEFLLRFLPGIQEELAARDILLIMHNVPDLATANRTYQSWRDERRVDGVLVLNPYQDDPRLPFLEQIGLPAVIIGDTREVSTIPSVWTDDEAAMNLAVEHLAALGHRRICRIGVRSQYRHSLAREQMFRDAMQHAGLAADLMGYHHKSDSGEEDILSRWLRSNDPPTALIHEDPTLAVEAMFDLQHRGIAVPDDLSIIGWDDSVLSEVVRPAMTTLHRDLFQYGMAAARQLVLLVDGEEAGHLRGTTTELLVRGSTAVPRA
ncbi:LacI family DNA-binding transcriptional regulator [Actinacidiphila sp. bgisy144]|jgi:DNA-binding LacI/PurR family transcriptional regulator|uniref:LacI family DNA-binding transcriptional regulator n=1 Tax=unclassified Actinacidiphila TaxID=2995708 RepID=UPI003EBA373A